MDQLVKRLWAQTVQRRIKLKVAAPLMGVENILSTSLHSLSRFAALLSISYSSINSKLVLSHMVCLVMLIAI